MLHVRLPRREPVGHKGHFGQVGVVGGCAHASSLMIGAPALAALGALRAGCGLVRIASPAPIAQECLTLVPSAIAIPLACDGTGSLIPHESVASVDALSQWASALVIGPGMGRGEGVTATALRAIQQDYCPVVVDADALNALAEVPDLAREVRGKVIFTPHPGEFARLAKGLGITPITNDSASRQSGAEALAQRLGIIVVLKGAGTVVTDGQNTWTCGHCVPTLAIPGSGDVLAGVIAGLIAQHRGPHTSLLDLVCIAVEAHAVAGETWAQCHHASGGMLASELAGLIPRTLEELREE